jgi:sortase B
MLELDGIKFRTQEEYDLACKDKETILRLKRLFDINTDEGITGIYRELQTVNFSSELGRRFDDEIFELYSNMKKGVKKETNEPVGVKKSLKNADIKEKGHSKTGNNSLKTKEGNKKSASKDIVVSKEVLREINRQNRKRSILVVFLVLISLGCIGYFVKYTIDARNAEHSANEWAELKDSSVASFISVETVLKKEYKEEVVIPDILDEYKALYNKNKSLIGWIKIDDTKIDYPVMQTVNNEYYLKHNFDQKEDANGCIFLDCNCDVILGNTNYIIYGHHMNSGKMFGSLVKYGNKEFYEKHKYIQFDTIYEKGTYEVMYAFRTHIYSSDEITFKYYQFIDANSEAEFDSAMEEMSKLSIYDTGVTAVYGDRLITLSTCDYQEENGRFAVVAKKIK